MSASAEQLPQLAENQNEQINPQRFTGEAGRVDLDALSQRTQEALAAGVDSARVAFHGLRARLAEGRASRAEDRAERMEHKDALYEHLGTVAIGEKSEITHMGETPKPRTFVERFVDKRIENKRFKRGVAEARRQRVHEAYGGSTASHTLGIGSKVAEKVRKHNVRVQYKNGELTAREKRQEEWRIEATPVGFENPEQRRVREETLSADKKFDRVVNEPMRAKWRAGRRRRAINAVPRLRNRAEEQRRLQEEVRAASLT